MDVKTPVSYIREDKKHIEMGAELPNGIDKITHTMDHKGPVLYNCST